jgi:acetylglutamate kinase
VRLLVKLGGTLLDDPGTRDRLVAEIAEITREAQVVVVHGGGKQMTSFLTERGVESRFVNGLRVTTPEILDAVLKVLAGSVNTTLVSAFAAAGVRSVGLTGVDGGLVIAEPLDPELGAVGRPQSGDPTILETLVAAGFLPVVACVAGDRSGRIYNVNADAMAVACAAAFRADRILFLTDVDGVRASDGKVSPQLTADACRGLIREGIATGGMQAKLNSALDALRSGAGEIHIVPGAAPGIVRRAVAGEPIGTRVRA